MTDAVDVAIVGAGVAGLVVAHDLARAGARVVVLEASDEVGGLLRRADLDGVSVDVGAESFATRTSGVADLIADAGLDLEIVSPAPAGAHLAARTDAGIVRAPLPKRTILGIPADPFAEDVVRILGPGGAARVAAERDLPPYAVSDDAGGAEPSFADLVARRCGPELVTRLVDPLCRSVYSRPAAAARLSRLHPALWAEFVRTGSLLDAADAVAASSRTGSAVAGIAGGMWRLPLAVRAAAERHGADVRTGVRVRGIRPDATGDGVVLDLDLGLEDEDRGAALTAAAVVVATGSRAAAALLSETPGETPREASAEAAPVRVVAALVRAAALDAHPVGSGVIVAPDVPSAAKALTHASAKWPWLGHDHGHVVRLSARDARARGLDTPAEIAAEIALLTGIRLTASDIADTTTVLWDDAIASPPVAPDRRQELASRGIHLAGASVAGTGLASVVPHARQLAATLAPASISATTGSPV